MFDIGCGKLVLPKNSSSSVKGHEYQGVCSTTYGKSIRMLAAGDESTQPECALYKANVVSIAASKHSCERRVCQKHLFSRRTLSLNGNASGILSILNPGPTFPFVLYSPKTNSSFLIKSLGQQSAGTTSESVKTKGVFCACCSSSSQKIIGPAFRPV